MVGNIAKSSLFLSIGSSDVVSDLDSDSDTDDTDSDEDLSGRENHVVDFVKPRGLKCNTWWILGKTTLLLKLTRGGFWGTTWFKI